MSVTSVDKDLEALTMTVTADLDATVERAWQLWADPGQFERWWGPPGYPVTVVDHDLRAGGRITFFMAGTEGERHDSSWEVMAADPPPLRLAGGHGAGARHGGRRGHATCLVADRRGSRRHACVKALLQANRSNSTDEDRSWMGEAATTRRLSGTPCTPSA